MAVALLELRLSSEKENDVKLTPAQIDRLKKLHQEQQNAATALGLGAADLHQVQKRVSALQDNYEQKRGALMAVMREMALMAGLDPDKPYHIDADAGTITREPTVPAPQGSVAPPAVVAGKRARRH